MSVLLLVAGLIAIATAVVTLSAAQRRAAQRAEQFDARRSLLDAAIRVAMAEIAFAKPDGPFWYPRQARMVKVGSVQVEVVLERETGRIDINTAEEKYLVAGLVAAGMDEPEARIGAARIRDWTDADDESRPSGAEREAYVTAGLGHEPRNAFFERPEELRQVLGLQGLSDDSLEIFTVYAQTREPSANDASAAVRGALAWLDAAAGEDGSNAALSNAAPGPLQSISHAGAVVRLRACLTGETTRHCRESVQRMTGNSRRPFLVMAWQ